MEDLSTNPVPATDNIEDRFRRAADSACADLKPAVPWQFPFRTIREIENGHIVLWLIKDACWCGGVRPLGMLMIIPTLAVAAHITWASREDAHDLWTNIAVCFWIAANAIWMTGEFYFDDGIRPLAWIFFGLGLLSLAYYYGFRARLETR